MRIFDRHILGIFGLAILVGMVIIALSLHNALNSVELNENTLQSRQRILLLENTQTKLVEAESSQRAFAFTGDPVFLEEYRIFRRELEDYLQQLQDSDFSAGTETTTINLLLDLVQQRLAVMQDLVTTRQEQGMDAAREKIASREGKGLMDKIRVVGQEITEQQIAALDSYRSKALAAAQRLLYLLGAGTVLTLLLMGAAFTVTRRELLKSEQLVKRLQNNSREITLVSQLNHSLQSCETHKAAGEVIHHYLRLLFPDVSGGIYLMRASRNLLQLSTTWNTENIEAGFMDPIEPQDCWALKLGKSQQITKETCEMHCAHSPLPEQGGYVCIPMMAQGEIVGMMHLRAASAINMDELKEHAEHLAAQIGAAIASITLRESLHLQNIRDPLTNLYNRRYLEETMEREQLRADRNHSSFGLIMLDLDHFKEFNDVHGHQARDAVLKTVAAYLQLHVRGEDLACRYGGEEFTLILPGATLEQSQQRAEILRQGIENTNISIHGQQLPGITGSFGVANYPEHADSWETVLHLADAALYQAKREGRNRVIVSKLTAAKTATDNT